MDYVVVSPVKDEAQNIERCIASMVRQTRTPLRWVVVDDGSTDQTAEIVEHHARQHSFITLLRVDRGMPRQTGVGELLAFNVGYEAVRSLDFECLVKLDGDMSFNETYFERLLEQFEKDPVLGIASGAYMEQRGGRWQMVKMPEYHAAGASKVIRRKCFEEIGGFIPHRGWDSVDEIRAMAAGWKTRHFPEIQMHHWRPEGAGMGYLATSYMHGEIYYRTGGSALFFLLKVARRLVCRPWIAGAAALAWGYLHNVLKRSSRLVSSKEAALYRALLHRRLFGAPAAASQE